MSHKLKAVIYYGTLTAIIIMGLLLIYAIIKINLS